MSRNKLVGRIGALSILLAILLRFASTVVWGSPIPIFAQPELAAFLVRSQTGRDSFTSVPSLSPAPTLSPSTLPTTGISTAPSTAPTTQPSTAVTRPPVIRASFAATDTKYVKMTYSCSYRPDLQALLTQKLNWDLSSASPTVLIVHTHGTESYTKTADTQYQNYGGSYRTDDARYNMISVGDALARLLEEAGIHVIHDRTAHDKDDYLNAYANSRKAVQSYLKQYPSIKLVLDLHRDAAEYADGTQWATSATVNGKRSAQLMFVVGTNAGGSAHPNWKQNLATAEKLHVLMEKTCSGITRPIDLRSQRFNHDLSPAAMIVEVGSAGNTHPEAMAAVSVLAEAIIALQNGSA